MKMFRGAALIFVVFVNFCEIYPAPAGEVDNSKTETLYNEYNLNPDGSYNYKYKLSDGQAVDVEAKLIDVDGSPIYRVKGFYTFEGTDGKIYVISYVADENGYRIGSSENAPPSITTTTLPTTTTPTPYETISIKTEAPPPLRPSDEGEINPKTFVGIFG